LENDSSRKAEWGKVLGWINLAQAKGLFLNSALKLRIPWNWRISWPAQEFFFSVSQ